MNDTLRSREDAPGSAELLESWKEIAVYLKRGVRTVRRWEKDEGLPVHRHAHKKLGTVYAYRSELDAWRRRRSGSTPTARAGVSGDELTPSRVMIAVLPFENLSGDPEQEYLSDGLTEEMINQLGRFNPLTLGVIARTTTMQYQARRRTIRQIGDELKVDYVLEGSVRRESDRLRVAARLIRVRDQSQLWSNAYEEQIRSVLSLQRELAGDIGREIRLTLSGRTQAKTGIVNPEAFHTYLRGRHLLNRLTPDCVRRSVEYFQRAIELDPRFAPSYASLAEAYERVTMWLDERPAKTIPLALEAVRRALELDPDLPEAHASVGVIAANYEWNWPKAERHFQLALELDSGCSPARHWYAEFLAEMGRIDEALETIERAQRHDPFSSSVQATRAFALLLGRRFDEAIAQARAVLEFDPDYPMALIRLGIAYACEGRYQESIEALDRAVRAAPELLDCKALLGYAQARAGNERAAIKELRDLRRLARQRYVPAFLFADIYMALGDDKRAVAAIEREYAARGWYLLLIKHGPQFDLLRANPTFQSLMQRMNFPP
jgi:TolB-like protein/tetratricopeptide (TPR) repeat protein